MSKIKLLIHHKDKEYTFALGRALALKGSCFAVELDTDEEVSYESIIQAARENKYDLFLVDTECKHKADRENAVNRERLLGLAETPCPAESSNYIYKYGGLDSISSQIQILYSILTGKRRIYLNGNKTEIIGVTSGAGGVGTSSVAISVARELVSLDRRDVLYVSFEETESTSVYMPISEGQASISEYLYYFFTAGKEVTSSFIDSFIVSDMYGLCGFRPACGLNELPDLSCDFQRKFLDSLFKSGRFRYIVIDFPARVSERIEHLMEYCHRILIVDDGRPVSLVKNQNFIDNISARTLEETWERITRVTNKWTPDNEHMPEGDRFYIEYDDESFTISDHGIEISLARRFGLGVRKIADELEAEI